MKRLLRLSLLPLLSMALAFSCQKIELPDDTADEDAQNATGGGNGASPSLDTSNALTVGEAMQRAADGSEVVIKGYIVGYTTTSMNNVVFSIPDDKPNTNMLLSDNPDEYDELCCLPVELPTTGRNLRGLLNLYDHPEYFNQYIAIQGKLTTYFRVVGLKSPTVFAFIAPPENSGGGNESGSGDNESSGGDEEEEDKGQGGSDGEEEKPDNPSTDGKNYPQISDSLTIIAGRCILSR
ncbi:MAG: DUF6359 domain-containing protein [Bacteroidales bacterium]|nr:DUF6359 domain-containing protein [Bacteroidales bacterium]